MEKGTRSRFMKKLSAELLGLAFVLAACSQPLASPTPTASSSPAATPSALATVSPAAGIDHAVVFLARDRLPPVARHLNGAGAGGTAEARIFSRVDALWAVSPLYEGEFNVVRQSKARVAKVTVQGDLATVDFTVPNDDWGLGGSAALRAFVQQLVYTASEEPGIARVLITQNGGKQAVIGGEGLTISGPTTREQQNAYALKGATETFVSGETASFITDVSPRVTVDEVAPALARFVVELRHRDQPADRQFAPEVTVEVLDAKDWQGPELGKKILKVSIPMGADSVPGMRIVDKSPLRAVWTDSAVGGSGGGTTYYVGLDDLRPWRVALLFDPVRVVLDVGGDPDLVSNGMTVYSPRWGATVDRTFTIAGLARAFEATVSWLAKDSGGKVLASGHTLATIGTSAFFGAYQATIALPASAKGTIGVEVFEASAKDGSPLNLVKVPVVVK